MSKACLNPEVFSNVYSAVRKYVILIISCFPDISGILFITSSLIYSLKFVYVL